MNEFFTPRNLPAIRYNYSMHIAHRYITTYLYYAVNIVLYRCYSYTTTLITFLHDYRCLIPDLHGHSYGTN